jgi:hypothetical protein
VKQAGVNGREVAVLEDVLPPGPSGAGVDRGEQRWYPVSAAVDVVPLASRPRASDCIQVPRKERLRRSVRIDVAVPPNRVEVRSARQIRIDNRIVELVGHFEALDSHYSFEVRSFVGYGRSGVIHWRFRGDEDAGAEEGVAALG